MTTANVVVLLWALALVLLLVCYLGIELGKFRAGRHLGADFKPLEGVKDERPS